MEEEEEEAQPSPRRKQRQQSKRQKTTQVLIPSQLGHRSFIVCKINNFEKQNLLFTNTCQLKSELS